MTATTTHYLHLAPNPASGYRQLFVKNTRIRARVLYGWFACAEPMTPEEIASDYDLPVDAVREAIAYCESNPPELHHDEAGDNKLMELSGMNAPGYRDNPRPRVLSPLEWAELDEGSPGES